MAVVQIGAYGLDYIASMVFSMAWTMWWFCGLNYVVAYACLYHAWSVMATRAS
jgi:hypothetical protein